MKTTTALIRLATSIAIMVIVLVFVGYTSHNAAPEALTATTIFPTANKFTLTTNGLLVQDTNTTSAKYRYRVVFRKGQFYPITRAYGNGSFALLREDGTVIVDRTYRQIRVAGISHAANVAGDSARAVAIDLWNQ